VTSFDFPHPVNEALIPAEHSEVYIEVGVHPANVAPVRVVAADLAARADFDLDAVSDLRMAVDEACSTLAMLAMPDARMRCTMQVDADRITVVVQIPSPTLAPIAQDTFGWRVLATLTDEVEVLGQDATDTASLGIRLVKERRPGVA
jgi:serine/threonine-protein kinase RsbW